MQKFKKLIIFVSTVAALMIPSTVAFAAEDEPREVETPVIVEVESELRGQEIETPDFVQEVISELQKDESSERVVYFPQPYAEIVDSMNVAAYRDWDFTNRSAPEPLVLQMSCDTISFIATCAEEGVTDTVVCTFIDNTYDGIYSFSLSFTADGSVTTIAWPLPEIRGKIYFTCNTHIAEAIAVFSKRV